MMNEANYIINVNNFQASIKLSEIQLLAGFVVVPSKMSERTAIAYFLNKSSRCVNLARTK